MSPFKELLDEMRNEIEKMCKYNQLKDELLLQSSKIIDCKTTIKKWKKAYMDMANYCLKHEMIDNKAYSILLKEIKDGERDFKLHGALQ